MSERMQYPGTFGFLVNDISFTLFISSETLFTHNVYCAVVVLILNTLSPNQISLPLQFAPNNIPIHLLVPNQ
jgi:hypothetical protein